MSRFAALIVCFALAASCAPAAPAAPTRAYTPTISRDFGDGLMMIMDWAHDGALDMRIIHQFGASERPDSPHYSDQSEMFARYQWRTLDW
jgi:acyl-homoserine lactone acylase PvdQ